MDGTDLFLAGASLAAIVTFVVIGRRSGSGSRKPEPLVSGLLIVVMLGFPGLLILHRFLVAAAAGNVLVVGMFGDSVVSPRTSPVVAVAGGVVALLFAAILLFAAAYVLFMLLRRYFDR